MEAPQTASFLHPRRTLKENRNAWQDGGGSDVLVSGPLQWVPSCLCAAPSQAALGPPSSGILYHVALAGPGPPSSLLPAQASAYSFSPISMQMASIFLLQPSTSSWGSASPSRC